MLQLINVCKSFEVNGKNINIFNNINLTISSGARVGILGRNGSGKSTLIKIIGGILLPDSGSITSTMTISWPLAFHGGFQGSLTGFDNLKFISRIYDKDWRDILDFVEKFSELGKSLYYPVKTYSSGMRARLAFGLSMAIDFDFYLIDEVLAVGDDRFHLRCKEELLIKRSNCGFILASHHADTVRSVCETAYVIKNNSVIYFGDIDEAFNFYVNS